MNEDLGRALDAAAGDDPQVDLTDLVWAQGRVVRRRRQTMTAGGLVAGGVAAGAVAFAALGGGDLGASEDDLGPARTSPTVDALVTEAADEDAATSVSEDAGPSSADVVVVTEDPVAGTAEGSGAATEEDPALAAGSDLPTADGDVDGPVPAPEDEDPGEDQPVGTAPLTSVQVPADCDQPARQVEGYALSHGAGRGETVLEGVGGGTEPLVWQPEGGPSLRVLQLHCSAGGVSWPASLVLYDDQAELVGSVRLADLDPAAFKGAFDLGAASVGADRLDVPAAIQPAGAGMPNQMDTVVLIGWDGAPYVVDVQVPVDETGSCSADGMTGTAVTTGAPAAAAATAQRLATLAVTCDQQELVALAQQDGTMLSFGGQSAESAFTLPETVEERYTLLAQSLTRAAPELSTIDGVTYSTWYAADDPMGWRVVVDENGTWGAFLAGD